MARTRSIRPGFFTNDALGELPAVVRLLFAGLWTVADRDGRLLDRPRKLKAELLAYDHVDVDKALEQLAHKGFIQRYESGGEHCIQVVNWTRHQHPHPREEASTLPAPNGYQAGPRPDLGAPPAVAEPLPGPSGTLTSSSFPSGTDNSLRENPPTPLQGGRIRKTERHGRVEFDVDGPRYEQRLTASGKREWVEVEA